MCFSESHYCISNMLTYSSPSRHGFELQGLAKISGAFERKYRAWWTSQTLHMGYNLDLIFFATVSLQHKINPKSEHLKLALTFLQPTYLLIYLRSFGKARMILKDVQIMWEKYFNTRNSAHHHTFLNKTFFPSAYKMLTSRRYDSISILERHQKNECCRKSSF